MKKYITKLILVSTVMTVFLFLPLLANSAAVPWSTETYRAYAYSEYNSEQNPDQQETFGPPLPISAYAVDSLWGWNFASSSITSSQMNIGSHSEPVSVMWSAHSDAVAEFSGTFTAVAPVFQFTYAYAYDAYGGTWAQNPGNDKFWISVYDATDSVSLYNNTLNFIADNSASNILNIGIQSGHEINVDFGVEVKSYLVNNKDVDGASINLTYGTAVAPEPISSILFVTGGTLLAGRRFISRKA